MASRGRGGLQDLDADHSGNISVAELLASLDADHSGTLDMKEMENLAARLTSQVRPHDTFMEFRSCSMGAVAVAATATNSDSGSSESVQGTPRAGGAHVHFSFQ